MAIPRLIGALVVTAAAAAISSCGGKEPVEIASGAGGPVPTRAVGGTVSGLAGTVVLQNNGSDNLNLIADGGFTFPGAVAEGGTYNVSILTQPANQTCSVVNGTGTVSSADVSNVNVTCLAGGFAVRGTIGGLSGSLSLTVNNYTQVFSTNGPFRFGTTVPDNTPYTVSVTANPASQTCTIANGTGTIGGADVTNVAVTCATNTFSVGGTASGLTGTVVLRVNGGSNLSVSANGPFTFPSPLADGSAYAVTVFTQPAGQSCSVTAGTGSIAGASVTGVGISCAANTFTVGGTVSGLSGNVVLQNNGADNLTVSANGGFAFPTALPNSSAYNVTVLTQPSGRTCTVGNGSGTVSGANATNVSVSCAVNTFSVGGAVSGLSGTVVLRINGGSTLSVSANGPFAFGVQLADGSSYTVTVQTQPVGQGCSVTGGTGTVAGANVTSVDVSCAANAFTVGGTVSGLSGSMVLQNNGSDNLTVSANGAFTFATALQTSTAYNVTVLTQPSGQTCTVANGSGSIGAAKVTTVGVSCSATAGGTYSTSFPSTENPISEGGKWVNGKTVGVDWNDVKTTPGKAFASILSGFNGASRYNDNIAHLSTSFMAFPANQYAQGTVFRVAGYDPSPSKHEVELHLRFQTSANNARGYEIMWGITGYLAVVRWNGALGDYTSISDTGDPGIGPPVDGDVLRAEIKGNIITIFKNGVSKQTIDVTSIPGTVWADGQPGMGFWPVDGSTPQNYGWKSYQAGPVP